MLRSLGLACSGALVLGHPEGHRAHAEPSIDRAGARSVGPPDRAICRARWKTDAVSKAGATTAADEPEPICTWTVPGVGAGEPPMIAARPGELTVVVGPNGSGKSALGHWLQQHAGQAIVRRIIAHRRLWLEYAGPDITSAQHSTLATHITAWSQQADSRWLDRANAQRAGFVLFELLAQHNDYNARVVEEIKQGRTTHEVLAEVGPSLLERINLILKRSHLGVILGATEHATFEAITADGTTRYPISEMSDGEKSALLLAAEVMTSPHGAVVIVDEPERHMHRSISAGLIEAVVADRPDCHFVVMTHDLDLAANLPPTHTTAAVLAGTSWSGGQPDGWDLRLVDQDGAVPESVRLAILGGRRQVLFLEGERHSLDVRLYEVLYPAWSLSPVGSCEEVIRAVTGLRTSQAYHWAEGRGVVDGDGRTDDERRALADKAVLALAVSEVESLYYCEAVRRAVAVRQAETLGQEAYALFESSTERGLNVLRASGTPTRLAASVAEKVLARSLVDGVPTRADLAAGVDPIAVSIQSPFPALHNELNALLSAGDLESAIRRFPVRETAFRIEVATSLGFKSIADYESAALTRLRSDADLRESLREIAGVLLGPSSATT
jgi:ABC-type cobalamin/Fe3+-siderophores transport system ATPase subunit